MFRKSEKKLADESHSAREKAIKPIENLFKCLLHTTYLLLGVLTAPLGRSACQTLKTGDSRLCLTRTYRTSSVST